MISYRVSIYTKGDKLPAISSDNFFHSAELFHIIERSPHQRPYLAVAFDDRQHIAGHILAIIRSNRTIMPPFFYAQGRIYGEGIYAEDDNAEAIFAALLHELTRKLKRKFCFYIEFSDISRKMFGYRFFKKEGYFPVNWQEVHNSLHSMPPEDRLSKKVKDRIEKIQSQGVTFCEAATSDDVHQFYQLLHGFYRFKIRRVIPPERQVRELHHSESGRIFLTRYHGHVIGGCLCVFSGGNVYLWYLAARRKRFALQHPNMMTIWGTLHWAWEHNYAHVYFLDVGLPLPKNPFRDFILSFGGKPVSSYRWFKINVGWVNRFMRWLFKE